VVRREFSDRVPTLTEYADAQGISIDTIQRTAKFVLPKMSRLLEERSPGPKPSPAPEALSSLTLRAINDLLRSLLPAPITRLLPSPERRGLIVQQVRHWQSRGVALESLAELLGLSTRTLKRWLERCTESGGQRVDHASRRPKTSPRTLPSEIRDTLIGLRRVHAEISVAEFTRLFTRGFRALLEEHGLTAISAKTVGRYLAGEQPKTTPPPEREAPRRGGYQYPRPLAMAWIDTTYFTIAGVTVHIVGAMEAFSRTALAAEVFVQENTAATIEVLSATLQRVPGLQAMVRDRGTPYLNHQVDEFLAARDCLPINAYPHFPIDKAALERWWRTLKDWLADALRPLEERALSEGRILAKQDVVDRVAPALRLFLRAYNLLPQAYLEGKAPIERLEAAIAKAGMNGEDAALLRQLAMERKDKRDLLIEVRDGLQLRLKLETMQSDFAAISKAALERAMRTCFEKLVLHRDPSIYAPYRYLLAIASKLERDLQREAQTQRYRAEQRQREQEQDRQLSERIAAERRARKEQPEQFLLPDLEEWIRWCSHPFDLLGEILERQLHRTLRALRDKLAAAFLPQLQELKQSLPEIIQRINPALLPSLAQLSLVLDRA
jgi:transposase InsO family protein